MIFSLRPYGILRWYVPLLFPLRGPPEQFEVSGSSGVVPLRYQIHHGVVRLLSHTRRHSPFGVGHEEYA